MMTLNEEQQEAVETTEGYVRVVAGAGSGKTRALTSRFEYLVNDLGILPSNILCVTFTNKAASEMRQRIRALTHDNDTGYISTFHGFCVTVLQEDSSAVSYPKSFLVLDNTDINAMLEIIYEERGLTLRDMTFSNARDMIEIRKLFKDPLYYKSMIASNLEELHSLYLNATKADDIIFYGYLYQEKKCFALDYNDLLTFTLYIFQENKEIREKWQQRLEYIMIDEFQDIDDIQYKLMNALCAYHKNLFVVGDSDQTIYSWRGASGKYLAEFNKYFVPTKTIMMNRNYRSTPEIIAVANSLIAKNQSRIKKKLVAMLPHGEKPIFFHAKSADEEAQYIVQKIKDFIASGVSANDIAVLFRAHYISRAIEEAFQRAELPYTLSSGVPFFERAEIKDSISYLRMIAYKDDLSFLRIANKPKRNIGERRISYLKEFAEKHNCTLYKALQLCVDDELFSNTKAKDFIALVEEYAALYKNMSITEIFGLLMNKSGYEKALRTLGDQERLDNLAELKQSMYEYETSCGEECSLENYLIHASLFAGEDEGNTKKAVRLMTVHKAKGLEFPIVFIAGLNENIFPSKKIDSIEAMEEERRLAFVAFTRAEKYLFLTDAEEYTKEATYRHPSRFIFDVDSTLLHYETEISEDSKQEAISYIEYKNSALTKMSTLSSLSEGDRVKHAILGSGVVLAIDREKKQYTIQFASIATPRKMSFKAPLEAG